MDAQAYKEMAHVQNHHWWFKARWEILSEFIDRIGIKKTAEILEIGCGTGGNIEMLKVHGNVSAIEMDDFARNYTEEQAGMTVSKGWLPDNMPFENDSFDLICMFDVLEHVEHDKEALQVLKKFLKPDGTLFITVPDYQWLFGRHDQTLHHHRRYTLSALEKSLHQAGYQVANESYFNSLLFPLVVVTRAIELMTKPENPTGNKIPNSLLNTVLCQIFRFEKRILSFLKIPFGTSIIISAKITPL